MDVFQGLGHRFLNAVIAVGSFDGVHRGHRLLIEKMNEKAAAIGGQAVVVTFDPHPRTVIKGDNRLLSTIDERLTLLEQAGAQNVVIINFTETFSKTSPEEFVQSIIIDSLGAKAVFIGEGHSFGKNKGGDENFLTHYPLEICHIDRFENISSTEIRAAIENGDMEQANYLLKSDYLIITPITDATKLLPKAGEYICQVDGLEMRLSIKDIKSIINKCELRVKKLTTFGKSQ